MTIAVHFKVLKNLTKIRKKREMTNKRRKKKSGMKGRTKYEGREIF